MLITAQAFRSTDYVEMLLGPGGIAWADFLDLGNRIAARELETRENTDAVRRPDQHSVHLRDDRVAERCDSVSLPPLVLCVYAVSGAGKSSLLRAGLVPRPISVVRPMLIAGQVRSRAVSTFCSCTAGARGRFTAPGACHAVFLNASSPRPIVPRGRPHFRRRDYCRITTRFYILLRSTLEHRLSTRARPRHE